MVRQVELVPAGCQPWNYDVVSACGDRFAYSATLAIYVYEVDHKHNENCLLSVMSEHKNTITSICWCPEMPDYLASSSVDGTITIWDVVKQLTVAKHVHKEGVYSLGWMTDKRQCLGFTGKSGPLWLWFIHEASTALLVKETSNFASPIIMFRWHHGNHNKVAFGHEDGSLSAVTIGTKSQKHMMKPESASDNESIPDPVIALEWDPLSKDYLLVCNHLQGVRLIDVTLQKCLMFFQLPSAAASVQTFSWVKNAPGMFITGDFKGGILRVWSVSNPLPIENIKIKGTGFHRLVIVDPPSVCDDSNQNNNASDRSSISSDRHISSTSEASSPAKVTKTNFTLPHAQVVCTFKDGGVGLYDIGRRRWIFLRDQGHIETIFDCKFSPENQDHLATASFDGTIKIWDITTMKCLKSSPGNEGVIYHISWAPSDLDCIAACTSKQGAFIWDINKGKVIQRFNHHTAKTSVYCVAWNHIDSKQIMTCGADGYCIIQQVDGMIIQKYKHPGAVFGCDWSPFNKALLATGCDDKILRIFHLGSSSDQPIKAFTGHESKVFHVKWNPLREGVLCSGSDDCHIRVWDYTRDQCTCVLSGHSGPVRGLNWNSEVSTILVSGSWDCTIRIWDTQDGVCLNWILDHGADVYGITSHPSRPFLLASSSRDSTVRLWSTTSLIQPVELSILAGKSWCEILRSREPTVSGLSSYILSGQVSKNLFKEFNQKTSDQIALLREFSKFFTHPCGTENLWDLVSVIQGQETLLSPAYDRGIMHRKHITMYKGSEAQELEMIKMSKFGGGIGALSKEDRLTEAANVHIKLGNVQRYCELMVELGKWERALAVAPAVSMSYWQQLNQRYCTGLLAEDSDELLPFGIAGGDIGKVVLFLTSRGQLVDAAVVAQSAFEGAVSAAPAVSDRKNDSTEDDDDDDGGGGDQQEYLDRLMVDVMEKLSDFHFRNGSPVLASCCHLAVDDQKKALSKLIRGNELELACSIGKALGAATEEMDIAVELLSRRCEALGKWDLGLDILKLQKNPALQQAKLCARCSSSMAEINALHYKAGLPSMEECESKGKALQSSHADVMERVKFYLLSPSRVKGLNIGLQFVKDKMKSPDWTADDVFPMLQLLGCMKTEKLQHGKCSRMLFELLILSAYIGALVAIKRQYSPVIRPLLTHAQALIQKENVTLNITEAQIEQDLILLTAAMENRLTIEMKPLYKILLYRCGSDPNWVLEPGPDCVGGSHLPSHSDVQVSILSSERIRGRAFFLEDGHSAMSLNEALMWAKVNPFSPLGSGVRINPF